MIELREIEHRGWSGEKKEWIYGTLVKYGFHDKFPTCMIVPNYSSALYGIEVDPYSIGQYTGAKDKHDVKIYEGDILKSTVKKYKRYGGINGNHEVYWNNLLCHFGLNGQHQKHTSYDEYNLTQSKSVKFEVIGNMYLNEELK